MKLLNAFDELFSNFCPHFKHAETFERARALAFSSVVTPGRRTITRLICSKNTQQQDWSADYKFFSMRPWTAQQLFLEILKECERHSTWPDGAMLIALDETSRKKTGKKIPGVTTLRDPMSLPYHVNLMPGLRFLQAAAIITPERCLEANRAIPIYFEEAAPAKKPPKNATDEVKEQYTRQQKIKRLSVRAHDAALQIRRPATGGINSLRAKCDLCSSLLTVVFVIGIFFAVFPKGLSRSSAPAKTLGCSNPRRPARCGPSGGIASTANAFRAQKSFAKTTACRGQRRAFLLPENITTSAIKPWHRCCGKPERAANHAAW